jgi:hypothetical protein
VCDGHNHEEMGIISWVEGDSQDLLFHYTMASVAVEGILATGQFRFGLFEATNDPREAKQWHISASIPDGVDFDVKEFDALAGEADRLLRRSVKLACFTEDAPATLDWNRVIGRGFGHSRLWSHYAENHSGVCIGFNRTALLTSVGRQIKALGENFHGAVDYVNDAAPPIQATNINIEQVDEFGLDAVISATVRQHWKRLFFTKDTDWASEHEYRWVIVNDEPLPVYVDVSGCIEMIVLGDSFSVNRLPSIHRLKRSWEGVEIARINYRTGQPQLVPVFPPNEALRRTHRRLGDVMARTEALIDAELDAREARLEGERVAAPGLSVLQEAVRGCATELRRIDDVEVQLYDSGFAAVPDSERERAPGVPRGEVSYSGGIMCVVENLPKHSHTLVTGIAVQTLTEDRVRLHAMFELERWLPGGKERTQLWRKCLVTQVENAEEAASTLSCEIAQRLEEAIAVFRLRRGTITAPSS